MVSYLQKLKEKCNISDELMQIFYEIFDKLQKFGYISKYQRKRLEKRLYNNIDTVITGSILEIDYKSGYYDAVKKELYIKDIKNIEAIYLRVLYALTTKSSNYENYVGYSSNSLSKSDYKIEYKNFGINRAICSSLICRLLYTEPTTLSIVPTYRTYNNDFLGRKIVSDNDIYFIETKILTQICYIFDLNIESLYSKLFYNPHKYLKTFFNKVNSNYISTILKDLDNISRSYANYNKLIYLNKCLNDNYKKIKIKIINSDIKVLEKEKEKINLSIRNALIPLNKRFSDEDENDLEINIESCLSETINQLEENILEILNDIQTTFVNYLIDSKKKYSNTKFLIKLKTLQNIAILENASLNKAIYDTIMENLIDITNMDDLNVSQKIKYSVINALFATNKYITTYNDLKMHILKISKLNRYCPLVALSLNNSFVNLVCVSNLELPLKSLKDNVEFLKFDSMYHIINDHSNLKDISEYEKMFTTLKSKFINFENIDTKDVYFSIFENNTYILILEKNNFSIFEVNEKDDSSINIKLVQEKTSEYIFKSHHNTLPILKSSKK